MDVIESEVHFLFECPLYSDIRTQYFNSIVCDTEISNMPDDQKLSVIMSDVNVKKTAVFIETALKKRKETLFQ